MPLVADPADRRLAQLWRDVVSRQLLESTGPFTLQGTPAWDLLVRLNSRLERRAQSLAARHPNAEWLWYLRRLPRMFEINDVPSTAAYCDAIATAITNLATERPNPRALAPTLVYPISDRAVGSMVRLHALTVALYEMHSALRWAGKGADIEFRVGERPLWHPDDLLRDAVQEYDRRANLTPLSAAGLAAESNILANPSAADGRTVMSVSRLPRATEIPVGLPNVGVERLVARFMPGWFPIGDYLLPNQLDVPAEIAWPAEALALIGLLSSAVLHIAEGPPNILGICNVGYASVHRDRVQSRLHVALQGIRDDRLGGLIPEDVSIPGADEALSLLTECAPALWPPNPGAPLRRAGRDTILVDFAAATQCLMRALVRPPGRAGRLGNAYGHAFEAQLQDVVDATPWRPSEQYRSQIRRQLKLNGNTVTDIDAIAERDGTVLLLDAKCRPFTAEYDRGEHSAVRNDRNEAEKAAIAWAEKVSHFRHTRSGDNYDLTSAACIDGAVVYPFLPFTVAPRARTEVLPNLRFVTSVAELRSALA